MEKFDMPTVPEEQTDMEIVALFCDHIAHPCPVPGGEARGEPNLRRFYIEEAKKILPKITDQEAREILEDTISRWSILLK